jgi:hypothetical protein
MPIPELVNGELPVGIHSATLIEIEVVFGSANRQRAELMNGLKRAARNLKTGGVNKIYIDGSFTTSKEEPRDIDGCWEANGADPQIVDPVFWKHSSAEEFHEVNRPAMKARYGLDFFQASGVFPKFFQTNRDGGPKGIVVIELKSEAL